MTDHQSGSDTSNRLSWPGESAPPPWAPPEANENSGALRLAEMPPEVTPSAPAEGSGAYNPFEEIVGLQKQLRVELHALAGAVERLAEHASAQAPAEGVDAVKVEFAEVTTAIALLGETIDRLANQSAVTRGALADVLEALSSQTLARKGDFETLSALIVGVRDEVIALRKPTKKG